jgi:hypothetical protein
MEKSHPVPYHFRFSPDRFRILWKKTGMGWEWPHGNGNINGWGIFCLYFRQPILGRIVLYFIMFSDKIGISAHGLVGRGLHWMLEAHQATDRQGHEVMEHEYNTVAQVSFIPFLSLPTD